MEETMHKVRLIFKISCFIALFSSYAIYADNLKGDYCMPIKWGNLIMRFIPETPDNLEGTLSVIHHDSDGPTCLVPNRTYILDNQQVDAGGVSATYINGLLYVSSPLNWSGIWDKKSCFGQPPNPC